MSEEFFKNREQSLVEQIKDELREKLGHAIVGKDFDMLDQKIIHDDLVRLEEMGITLTQLGFQEEDIVALRLASRLWQTRRH